MFRLLTPQNLGRAIELITDRKRPWRRVLFALKLSERFNTTPQFLTNLLLRKLEKRLPEHPEALVPYLDLAERRHGQDYALTLAQSRSAEPQVSARALTEIAKYHYRCGAIAIGDSCIERAKGINPRLARIYVEEAWNHRARGNLHREIQAVEQLISLTAGEPSNEDWQIWLGEALVRNARFAEAWRFLRRYDGIPSGDDRLLTVAYCAVQLGRFNDVEAAYRRFASLEGGEFDRLKVAETQLNTFQRADEVARLVGDSTSVPTKMLELSWAARLQLGETHKALSVLKEAATRSDRQAHTLRYFGYLLELTGDSPAALNIYLKAQPDEVDSLSRFRRSELLAASDEIQLAVELFLENDEIAPLPTFVDTKVEVDPSLTQRLGLLSSTTSGSEVAQILNQVMQRASTPTLRTLTSRHLARALAKTGDWASAWNAIRFGQTERLPWIPLTVEKHNRIKTNLSIQYAELCETEPLNPEMILYESSLGATTSCNPFAMCKAILHDARFANFTHIWSIAPGATVHPALRDAENIVFVRKGSLAHFYYLAISKYIINNSTIEYEFTKREGQHYLNTWHGVPWKTMGIHNRSEPFAYGNISRNFLHADVVLCPDPHTRQVLAHGHNVHDLNSTAFVECGYPRHDLIANLTNEEKAAIRAELGLDHGQHLVLYMPTWTGTFSERHAEVTKVLEAAASLSIPGVTVALRAHHYVAEHFGDARPPEGLIMVPPHLDTNELIGSSDAVVTDFSSVLFDAAAASVPVVKLTTDLEDYKSKRGLYFEAAEVPGASALTIQEARWLLESAIADPITFINRYAAQTSRFNLHADGNASQQAIELLLQPPSKNNSQAPCRSKAVMISTGGLPPNGITQSARSLLIALNDTDYLPFLMPTKNGLDGADPGTIRDISQFSRIIPLVGGAAGTRMEREALQYFSTRRYFPSELANQFLEYSQLREGKRRFAATEFFSAIDFSAYDSKNAAMINFGVRISGGKRGVLFHNEMLKEVENKYPRLRASFYAMSNMDFLASVSDGVRNYNQESLHSAFGLPRDKHITIENTINIEEIRRASTLPLDAADSEWYESEGAHVCVIARLSPEKNHSQLFRALASVRDAIPRRVKITCLGDGPLRQELAQQITALGLNDVVRLRGQVENPQAHLLAAGHLILPSLHEGQPLVLLEALTLGVPVAATDTPGSRSVLEDGRFGLLVEISNDGLTEALHLIAADDLPGGESLFIPEEFTAHSLGMFLDAIDPHREG